MALDFLKSLREQSHLPTEYLLAIARDDFAFFPTALDEHHEMIILDLSCNSSADLLNQSAIKLSMHYTWLILTTNAQQVQSFQSISSAVPHLLSFLLEPRCDGNGVVGNPRELPDSTSK